MTLRGICRNSITTVTVFDEAVTFFDIPDATAQDQGMKIGLPKPMQRVCLTNPVMFSIIDVLCETYRPVMDTHTAAQLSGEKLQELWKKEKNINSVLIWEG